MRSRLKNTVQNNAVYSRSAANSFLNNFSNKVQIREMIGASSKQDTIIDEVQAELRKSYNFEITNKSLYYLAIYIEYYRILSKIICIGMSNQNSKSTNFLEKFTQEHCSQTFGKLVSQFKQDKQQLQRADNYYRHQCLQQLFQINKFKGSQLVKTLISKIVKKRMNGEIRLEQKKKQNKYLCKVSSTGKENKKHCQQMSLLLKEESNRKRIGNIQHNSIYYSILKLKVMLRESQANFQQIDNVCKQIKNDLEETFNCLLVKNIGNCLLTQRKTKFYRPNAD